MDPGETAGPRPWLAVGREITALLDRIEEDDFDGLVRAFGNIDRRWFFSGQGRSGLAAQMSAMRFMHIGRKVHFVGEATAPPIRAGDGLLIVSGSGETPTSIGFARIAKSEGAEVFAITRAPPNTLSRIADGLLRIPVAETEQFGGSLFEQVCLIVLDSVILEFARRQAGAHESMRNRHTNLQ
jgi:6-phospho-3-hexuloisomerase